MLAVDDHDTRVGDDVRIVQRTPPGSVQGLQLVVSDIEAARAELVERGVAVSAVHHYEGADRVDGQGGDWNSFAFFSDPDGNGWAVQESPARD